MKYCITMEQTRRIAAYFEADCNEDAEVKAIQINRSTSSEDFESGDEERLCALQPRYWSNDCRMGLIWKKSIPMGA